MKIDKGVRENFLSRAWGKFMKITDGYGYRSYPQFRLLLSPKG